MWRRPCAGCGGSATPSGRRRPSVVVDTGALVSAFAFGGAPALALREVVRSAVPYVSPDILDEYRRVPAELLARHKITAVQWRSLVSGFAAFVAAARLVAPRRRLSLCRDPTDDMFLECCAAARAAVLVTGDLDLLAIPREALRGAGLGRLRIVTPRAYLRQP